LCNLVGEASIGLSASRSTEALQSAAIHVHSNLSNRHTSSGTKLGAGGLKTSTKALDNTMSQVDQIKHKKFYSSCPDVGRITGWIAQMFKSKTR
jgi:hypothetical protein